MASTIVGQYTPRLAEDEIWHHPERLVLVHHDTYSFNFTKVEDVVSIILADSDDAEILDDLDLDPLDLMGDSFQLQVSELRALAQALLDAADKADARAAARREAA